MKILESPDLLAQTQDRLEQIKTDIAAIVERRRTLLVTACAELNAAGLNAVVVTSGRRPHVPGDSVVLQDKYSVFRGERAFSQEIHPIDAFNPPVGPRIGLFAPEWPWADVYNVHPGFWEVLLVDDKDHLIARVPTDDTGEVHHRRSVSRLRNVARREDLRVQVHDREITIADPVGNALHIGDVLSAYLWFANIGRGGRESSRV